MVKKITTILLLTVILTSLFVVVFSSVALANRPNYTVCWFIWAKNPRCWLQKCCSGYGGSGGDIQCRYYYDYSWCN